MHGSLWQYIIYNTKGNFLQWTGYKPSSRYNIPSIQWPMIYLPQGIAEVYRLAKRVHTASRGFGKKFMSPSKRMLCLSWLLNYWYFNLDDALTKVILEARKNWSTLCTIVPKTSLVGS